MIVENHAQIIISPARPFCILQLTDFHNDQGDDLAERTYQDIRAIIRFVQPDLLAVTGDIWCGDDKPDLGPMLMRRDLDFLGSLGVPWAFIWGNHDYIGDWDTAMNAIAHTPNVVAPRGNGRGSFRLELTAKTGGKLGTVPSRPFGTCLGQSPFFLFSQPVWDLFFLNSGLEWHLPDDLEWFDNESARLAQERSRVVPAIVYAHIPIRLYEEAAVSGNYVGFSGGGIHCWGDDGSAWDHFRQSGNVRAMFVGHSHKNDFWFERDGAILSYGRATGYGSSGGELLRKGAKRLRLEPDGNGFRFDTVFADGTTWGRVQFSDLR